MKKEILKNPEFDHSVIEQNMINTITTADIAMQIDTKFMSSTMGNAIETVNQQ
jgi:hypothetical protein